MKQLIFTSYWKKSERLERIYYRISVTIKNLRVLRQKANKRPLKSGDDI